MYGGLVNLERESRIIFSCIGFRNEKRVEIAIDSTRASFNSSIKVFIDSGVKSSMIVPVWSILSDTPNLNSHGAKAGDFSRLKS